MFGEFFYEASCVSNLDFNLGWVLCERNQGRTQLEIPDDMY
ncbi:MAG: hypothetical protein QG568_446 [Patescibacteria group bacterium]|nr:hypothetical protein [Patescibacteria group bacterium]